MGGITSPSNRKQTMYHWDDVDQVELDWENEEFEKQLKEQEEYALAKNPNDPDWV